MQRNIDIFTELSEHVQLRIHSCKSEAKAPGWTESKVHHDYDIWLVTAGRVRVQTDAGAFTAAEGDLIFHYPHTPYSAHSGEQGCQFVYIHFDFGLGEHFRILNDFLLSGILPSCLIRKETALFLEAFRAYEKRSAMSALQLKGCLHLLLARILAFYGEEAYIGAFIAPGRAGKRNVASLQPTISHIHEHLDRTIPISELAERIGMSEKYFIQYFKKTVGVPPGKYMHQLKMNRARDYLHQQAYSVKQIAGLLGYPDAYTFSKAFKKHYRVPPSKFV
jgi:AraC family transcriptional regulator